MVRLPKAMNLLCAALLAAMAAPVAVSAELSGSVEQNDTKAQVRQQYGYTMAQCKAFYGAKREKCEAEARAVRKDEMAQAEAGHREAQRETTAQAEGDKEIEAQRRLALARCDRLPQADKAACLDQARARFGK